MLSSSNVTQRPWYKEPWIWFVLAIPGVTVVLCLTMLVIASQSTDSLVRDNYYKDGLKMNRELSYETKADEWALDGSVQFDNKTGSLLVRMQGLPTPPTALTLTLLHPTQAQKDREFTLIHAKDGVYRSRLNRPVSGRYHLHLTSEAQKWRIKTELWLESDQPYPLR